MSDDLSWIYQHSDANDGPGPYSTSQAGSQTESLYPDEETVSAISDSTYILSPGFATGADDSRYWGECEQDFQGFLASLQEDESDQTASLDVPAPSAGTTSDDAPRTKKRSRAMTRSEVKKAAQRSKQHRDSATDERVAALNALNELESKDVFIWRGNFGLPARPSVVKGLKSAVEMGRILAYPNDESAHSKSGGNLVLEADSVLSANVPSKLSCRIDERTERELDADKTLRRLRTSSPDRRQSSWNSNAYPL